MLLISILLLLYCNALTSRRDLGILYNRLGVIALTYCTMFSVVNLTNLHIIIDLHGGLVRTTHITQIIIVFLLYVTTLILFLSNCCLFYSVIFPEPPMTKKVEKNNRISRATPLQSGVWWWLIPVVGVIIHKWGFRQLFLFIYSVLPIFLSFVWGFIAFLISNYFCLIIAISSICLYSNLASSFILNTTNFMFKLLNIKNEAAINNYLKYTSFTMYCINTLLTLFIGSVYYLSGCLYKKLDLNIYCFLFILLILVVLIILVFNIGSPSLKKRRIFRKYIYFKKNKVEILMGKFYFWISLRYTLYTNITLLYGLSATLGNDTINFNLLIIILSSSFFSIFLVNQPLPIVPNGANGPKKIKNKLLIHLFSMVSSDPERVSEWKKLEKLGLLHLTPNETDYIQKKVSESTTKTLVDSDENQKSLVHFLNIASPVEPAENGLLAWTPYETEYILAKVSEKVGESTTFLKNQIDISDENLKSLVHLFDITLPGEPQDLYGIYFTQSMIAIPHKSLKYFVSKNNNNTVHLFKLIGEYNKGECAKYLKDTNRNSIFLYTGNNKLFELVFKREMLSTNKIIYIKFNNELVPYDPTYANMRYKSWPIFLKDKHGAYHELDFTMPNHEGKNTMKVGPFSLLNLLKTQVGKEPLGLGIKPKSEDLERIFSLIRKQP